MKAFSMLLDGLLDSPPEQCPTIERLIRETFGKRKAVLALDMSGFTLSVRRDGILPYLCQVRRMQRFTLPVVHAHRGEVVKYEADNLLAVFDEPASAVDAAVAIQRAGQAPTDGRPALAFSIGIDYGELLLVTGADCFGDPVNLAYKLGEDVARAGEVLITAGVKELLGPAPPFRLEETHLSVSGVDLVAYSVSYGTADPGAPAGRPRG